MPSISFSSSDHSVQPLHLGNFDLVTDTKGQPVILGKGTFGFRAQGIAASAPGGAYRGFRSNMEWHPTSPVGGQMGDQETC
jgi:hypothetical protein